MTKDKISELEVKVADATSIDALWMVISKADASFRAGNITDLEEALLAARIEQRALKLGDEAQTKIIQFVEWSATAAMCMPASEVQMVRIQMQETRTSFGKFLRGLKWPLRYKQTTRALKMAVAKLGSDSHKSACWLINSIGWRSPEITKVLWNASQNLPHDQGDLAFSVLCELGVPISKRVQYVAEANKRYIERRSRINLFAIGHLASRESLRVLTFPSSWSDPKEESENLTFIPPMIALIADRNNSRTVTDSAVSLLRSLFTQNPEKMTHGIYLTGNVMPNCDSVDATHFLLELLTRDGNQDVPATHKIFLLLHRLEDFIRPQQLIGYEQIVTVDSLGKFLEKALTEPNDYTGRSATYEGDIRDRLWNLSLMIGNVESQDLAYKLLEADKNPYTRFKVIEDLACFKTEPISEQIAGWITDESNPVEAGSESILRMTAQRLAWSAESEEAFNLLLESKYITNGHTLADSVDGLAHLAMVLTRDTKKRRRIVKRIFDKLLNNPAPPTSGMVCEAIHTLAFSKRLTFGDFEKLSDLTVAQPEWMEPYDLSRIISALSQGPKSLIVGDLQEKLVRNVAVTDVRLATSCFETLISAGHFSKLPPEALARLGLSQATGQWIYSPQSDAPEPNGGLFVMLLRKEYDRFVGAFAAFLESSPFRPFVQAVEALERNGRKAKIRFSPLFSEALVQRAKAKNTLYDSEPYVFRCLATHDYKTFAEQDWPSLYSEWAPESREALATAFLKGLPKSRNSRDQALATLGALHGDFNFGVRRAAFRSLGKLQPELLTSMVKNLASANSPDYRILAAEAIYWIPNRKRRGDWRTTLEHLRSDEAEDVRDAARDARERARKLNWADQYLTFLTADFSKSESNAAVLQRWKYGYAIAKVGDDQTAQSLRHHLATVNLPANYQRFLIKTIEALEKNWQKCRGKWPQPMFSGNVSISSGEGTVLVDNDKLPVQYVVWNNTGVSDRNSLVFGGIAVLPERITRTDLIGRSLKFIRQGVPNAEIFVNQIHNQIRIEFGGQEIAKGDQPPGY